MRFCHYHTCTPVGESIIHLAHLVAHLCDRFFFLVVSWFACLFVWYLHARAWGVARLRFFPARSSKRVAAVIDTNTAAQ